jgi:hypothetical protein
MVCVFLAWFLTAIYHEHPTFMFYTNMLYLGFMYWILFDIELNYFRKKPLLYNGRASIIDRFEESFRNPGALLGLKIILMLMCSFVLMDL